VVLGLERASPGFLQAEGEEAEEAEVAEGAEIFYTEARRLVRWVPERFRGSSFRSHPIRVGQGAALQ
jgi:hypothetical protein